MNEPCRLCDSLETYTFLQKKRTYVRCRNCDLIFVPTEELLPLQSELDRYSLHDNSFTNKGYHRYLSNIASHLLTYSWSRAIDYGSGEEAVLTRILQESGKECVPHDPAYNLHVPSGYTADCIIFCESIEHLYDLKKAISEILRWTSKDSLIYIKTGLHDSVKDFSHWWYISDPTHVTLFSTKTMDFFAKKINGTTVFMENDIAVIKRKI